VIRGLDEVAEQDKSFKTNPFSSVTYINGNPGNPQDVMSIEIANENNKFVHIYNVEQLFERC